MQAVDRVHAGQQSAGHPIGHVVYNDVHARDHVAGRLEQGREALAQELDDLHHAFGKPIIITEFGADSLPGARNSPPEMSTEEY